MNNSPHCIGLGSWDDDPAERTVEHRRPLEPDPDNTGGGKEMNERKPFFSTRILAEVIAFVALAAVLSLIRYTLAQGGSINLGMVPILWLALRRGPKIGAFAGAVFGLVDLTIEPFVVNPVQFLLDYPLAFAALGLTGLFASRPIIGVVVGITGRFVSHFISGIVFFSSYAWAGWSPVAYSAAYNGAYLIPDMIICVFVILLLQKSNALKLYM
jgi:thiamine transporter